MAHVKDQPCWRGRYIHSGNPCAGCTGRARYAGELYFLLYAGALEERTLDLIGAKMKAVQVFFGGEVGGALVGEGDEGDPLTGLVRSALGGISVGRAEGIFSMGGDALVTESPIGCPTAISPRMVTFAELAVRRRELIRTSRARRRQVRSANRVSSWCF